MPVQHLIPSHLLDVRFLFGMPAVALSLPQPDAPAPTAPTLTALRTQLQAVVAGGRGGVVVEGDDGSGGDAVVFRRGSAGGDDESRRTGGVACQTAD